MSNITPFPKKKRGQELADAAQKAVEQGLSPNHPALRNITRSNVVPLKPKAK
jgi:hypothetical protein